VRIPQIRSWFWSLLHPIQAAKIRAQNKIVIAKLREAAIATLARLDIEGKSGVFDKLSTDEMLKYVEDELQRGFYKVLTTPDEADDRQNERQALDE
jgi:hypothetical protein